MQSPFGILDWGIMPLVSIVAGYSARFIYNRCEHKLITYIAMLIFTSIISLGVGFVLYIGAGLPYIIGFAEVFITVGVANMIGIPLINKLVVVLSKRNLQV